MQTRYYWQCSSVSSLMLFLLFQIKDSLAFQTRIKLGEEFQAQVIPLQVQAGRPPYLAGVRLGTEEEQAQQQAKPQQSFLAKYVRIPRVFCRAFLSSLL
jgi:hypothetical protein